MALGQYCRANWNVRMIQLLPNALCAYPAGAWPGQDIYQDFCVNCHMANGEGVVGSFPPLAKSDFLMEKRKESIKAIKYGMQGEIVVNGQTYNSVMANLGLLESEVADVMNYITNSWGNTNTNMVTEAEVAEIKK